VVIVNCAESAIYDCLAFRSYLEYILDTFRSLLRDMCRLVILYFCSIACSALRCLSAQRPRRAIVYSPPRGVRYHNMTCKVNPGDCKGACELVTFLVFLAHNRGGGRSGRTIPVVSKRSAFAGERTGNWTAKNTYARLYEMAGQKRQILAYYEANVHPPTSHYEVAMY